MEPNECLWCGHEGHENFKANPHEVLIDIKSNKQVRALVCPDCWEKHLSSDPDSDEFKDQLNRYASKYYGLKDPQWLCFRN